MTLYSPHYIDHFCDRFIELDLRRYGLTFEQYLVDPQHAERVYLNAEPRPLLAAQRVVQARLDAAAARAEMQSAEAELEDPLEAELSHLPRRNGTCVEPLHHRRYYKRSAKADFRRRHHHAG